MHSQPVPLGDCSERFQTPAIAFDRVSVSYESEHPVLTDLSFSVVPGEVVAITGGNGSGKSTIAKMIDALLLPDSGSVRIFGMDTGVRENLPSIRSACGMVFQNPDDQLVCTLVHDEVAFGPRNFGLDDAAVHERVEEALHLVGLDALKDADVSALSGGQKQRVALAGALAMHPRVLILDEVTSMLDASAVAEVVEVLKRLNDEGTTLVLITHERRLEGLADRVIRLDSEEDDAPRGIRRVTALQSKERMADTSAIEFDDVTFSYANGASPALENISLRIQKGEFVCISGDNGSGKSTLLKHMNGLLQAQTGEVRVFGRVLTTRKARNEARLHVGLSFQFPEQQLFKETVYDDVAFGPRNLGVSEEEVQSRVREALGCVGLPFDEIYQRNPFTLSGGQQRKVAIAGILALRTPVLALDEPCAGLDARSKRDLLNLLVLLNEQATTVIMVSHSSDDVGALGCREIRL